MAAKKNKPELPPRIYEIDFARDHDFEIGALLLVLMAFPLETIKNEELERYTSALCTWALMERGRRDKAWAGRPLEIEPKLFSVPENEVARIVRTFKRRLRDRAYLGRAANHLIFKTTDPEFRLPDKTDVSTQSGMLDIILCETKQQEEKNAAQRIWLAGLPSVHISAALQAFLHPPTIRTQTSAGATSSGALARASGSSDRSRKAKPSWPQPPIVSVILVRLPSS